MKRLSEAQLSHWFHKSRRKPLIVRGARQVGKSTLVRNFAKDQKLKLAEINLEKHGNLNDLFASNDLKLIIPELEILAKTHLNKGNVLLFLDEIQTTPNAIAALRYFYEEMPQLPVIAAGSLLEFVLEEHEFSMPVGRVEYLHLGPMTFAEFLMASGEDMLLSCIESFTLSKGLPQAAHQQLLRKQREYLFIGGMPESVLAFSERSSMLDAREIHRSIIQTYQDDFSKYSRNATLSRVRTVFDAIPSIVGQKVKYSNISRDERSGELKRAINLLTNARLLLPAFHSRCSGLPLAAGINEKHYKLFFLDIGLLNYLFGLDWPNISSLDERALLNEGVLAEQFIAQHLAYRDQGLEAPNLIYWLRENKSANAEVDFVTSSGSTIVPLEIKSGKSGTMKSLQQFVLEKQSNLACRFDLNPPTIQNVSHKTAQSQKTESVDFQMLSLPLYLIEKLPEILKEAVAA